MKKTLLTLAMMLAGMLSTQAQSQSLILDDSKDDMVTKINEAAEKGGTYNIRFSKRTINLNTWNVLVLPFDVKPGVIGKAFGSRTGTAAVDVLNVNNENPNTMHFSIVTSGVIPAGTPFIILATEGKTTFREVTDFTNIEVKKRRRWYRPTRTATASSAYSALLLSTVKVSGICHKACGSKPANTQQRIR